MGHHLFDFAKHRRRRPPYRASYRYDDGARYDNGDRYDDSPPERGPRIPGAVLLGGIVLWSLLALGLWALVDPLLAWAASMAGPAADLGVGLAGWFGLGKEASALRAAANVDSLAGWAVGPLHFLLKAGLILVWIAGAVALTAAPAILRRRSRW